MIADRIVPRPLRGKLGVPAATEAAPAPEAPRDTPLLKEGRRDYLVGAVLPELIPGVVGGGLLGAGALTATASTLAPLLAAVGLATLAPVIIPALGVVAGVGVGVALALERAQKFKGEAQITIDGGKPQTVPWYWNSDMRGSPDSGVQAALLASGAMGDPIFPGSVTPDKLQGQPDPVRLQAWAARRDDLDRLATNRRLVADLGNASQNGKPVLQLISLTGAKELLARNQPVYVVGGQQADQVHTVRIATQNGARDNYSVTSHTYSQRRFDYTLKELKSPTDLDNLPAGGGVPDGMAGVLRDAASCSQPIFDSTEHADRKLAKTGYADTFDRATHQSAPGVHHGGDASVQSSLANLTSAPLKPAMVAGGVLGLVLSAALALPPVVGIAGGVALGRILGGMAVRKKYGLNGHAAATSSTPLKEVLLTAAGAAIGIGLALHPMAAGLPAMIVGFVGGVGAMYTLQRKHTQVTTLAGLVGALGGALASGAMMPGSLPVTASAVVLGLLGAFAGRISTHMRLLTPVTPKD